MIRRARPILGTFFEISLEASTDSYANNAITYGFEEATRLENMLSFFKPESELARLNSHRAQIPQNVSPEFIEVLTFCAELSALSMNRFNIATPETSSVKNKSFTVEGDTVLLARETQINLGGVAKGYIVDRTIKRLLETDVSNIIVNAGGDLRVARSEGISIGIRDPRDPSRCADAITIASGAVATSGPYFAFSKLFDPLDREFIDQLKSVSVIASSCMVADALTKVVALKVSDLGPILTHFGATALILSGESDGSLSREQRE